MKKIVIISASVRDGRLSHRTALFLHRYITDNSLAECEILDLKAYDFPLFHERLQYQQNPTSQVLDFVRRVVAADGVIFATPVYNGSFPASLKNVIDLLYKEWRRKPIAVVSTTYTPTPGIATIQQIQAIMLKLGSLVAPALATVTHVATELSEEGQPADPDKFIPKMRPAIDELLWLIEKTRDS